MSGFRIRTPDGEELEARWDAPRRPAGVVVLCHPHPLDGGTMTAPLLEKVTPVLAERGLAVLRFNFRGVGSSSGSWSGGGLEVDDVGAAIQAARAAYPELPPGLAGWSFGAATALRWEASSGEGLPYVGIAPPVSSDRTPPLPDPADLPEARRRLILGDRDQFTTEEELRAYAEAIGAELVVLRGSDHFFYFREEKVGELTAEALAP